MNENKDQQFFARLSRALKGRWLDRANIMIELKAHLGERRHERASNPAEAAAILGHPVDLADEYNYVFRWRRRLRRSIIAAPAALVVAFYILLLASDFPLAQMPFGVFTTLSLGEVGWVTSKIGVSDEALVDCSLPPFVQSDFLATFGIPRAWHSAYESKDARCLSVVDRKLAADVPEAVRARFDQWRGIPQKNCTLNAERRISSQIALG